MSDISTHCASHIIFVIPNDLDSMLPVNKGTQRSLGPIFDHTIIHAAITVENMSLNHFFLNCENISESIASQNKRVCIPENTLYCNDKFFLRSEVHEWAHSWGGYQANMCVNGFHLPSEPLLSISLHCLNNIFLNLDLPGINISQYPLNALNMLQHAHLMQRTS